MKFTQINGGLMGTSPVNGSIVAVDRRLAFGYRILTVIPPATKVDHSTIEVF